MSPEAAEVIRLFEQQSKVVDQLMNRVDRLLEISESLLERAKRAEYIVTGMRAWIDEGSDPPRAPAAPGDSYYAEGWIHAVDAMAAQLDSLESHSRSVTGKAPVSVADLEATEGSPPSPPDASPTNLDGKRGMP